MTNTDKIKFTMPELTRVLIKEKGITEGKWILAVEFGIAATNAGPDDNNLSPAALIPIISIGLVKSENNNNLTVDAAEVNKEN